MTRFSDYLETLARENRLGNGRPVEWLFHCGMLFSSRDKWWGDFKFRQSGHEGIDITYFRTPESPIARFDDSTRIPAMEDGKVINICDDFLGQTLVVEDEAASSPGWRVVLAYAHIRADQGLTPGKTVLKGEIIAQVCDSVKNPQLPPHLHLSCFEIPEQIQPRDLNWNLFAGRTGVRMIQPVFL